METLTYDYGETPEEVVREAAINAPDPTEPEWVGFVPPDDLLTVLGDLAKAAAPLDPDEPHMLTIPQMRSRNLRVSILAALGVTEV